jgi:hypothetical protein
MGARSTPGVGQGLPRGRVALAAALGACLWAPPALAANIVTLAWTQNTAQSSLTLRLPRTGSFTMDEVTAGYLIVASAVTGDAHLIDSATWTSTLPGAGPPQAFHLESARQVEDPTTCRSELWGLAEPVAGPGFATVTVRVSSAGSNPPTPSLAATLISFSNVASTEVNGPCCANAANSGVDSSTISKTMSNTSRGDALVNTVCTRWTGTPPGMPAPDPDNDPEMVPRTFQALSSQSMQHFTGTSPGADIERPGTSYRHLRWLQSGSRSWAIAGLVLHATTTAPQAPDAAGPTPPDAAPAPMLDAAPTLDSAPTLTDGATGSTASPDATSPGPMQRPDGGAAPEPPALDALGAEQRQISLQVGCACGLGRGPGGGGLGLLLLLPLLRRRRARE